MMKSSNVRYDSLAAVLEEIGNKGAKGAVVAGVVLTYDFDPEFVRSLAYQGLLAYDAHAELDEPLRWAGAFPVALFFDPKRARSLGRTPGNFEIHFAAREGWGAHHPKAYAFALRDGGFELVLGSFNLTFSGVCENRELLLRFSLAGEEDEKPDAEALRMHLVWRDFLKSTYGATTHSPALEDYLKRLDARLESLKLEPDLNARCRRFGSCPQVMRRSPTDSRRFETMLKLYISNPRSSSLSPPFSTALIDMAKVCSSAFSGGRVSLRLSASRCFRVRSIGTRPTSRRSSVSLRTLGRFAVFRFRRIFHIVKPKRGISTSGWAKAVFGPC